MQPMNDGIWQPDPNECHCCIVAFDPFASFSFAVHYNHLVVDLNSIVAYLMTVDYCNVKHFSMFDLDTIDFDGSVDLSKIAVDVAAGVDGAVVVGVDFVATFLMHSMFDTHCTTDYLNLSKNSVAYGHFGCLPLNNSERNEIFQMK